MDKYPSADVPLKNSALISQQPYDVSIVLHMPRDPINQAAGNFMVNLALHGDRPALESKLLKAANLEEQIPSTPLHQSRRPAILPYKSSLSSLVSRLLHLPFQVLSFHDSDSVVLTIPMFEEVEFARGRANVPVSATIELQSQRAPQALLTMTQREAIAMPHLNIYSAKLVFQVRFHGLRYIIYNYRVLAFTVFSALFYIISISSLAIAWTLLATVFGKHQDQTLIKSDGSTKIKLESGHEASDPMRTTTDYKSDQTLKIKAEDDSENDTVNLREAWNSPSSHPAPRTTGGTSQEPTVPEGAVSRPEDHADDEEEESDDEWQQLEKLRRKMEEDARQRYLQRQQHDSGLGTSMESENTSSTGLVRRTSSKKGSNRV